MVPDEPTTRAALTALAVALLIGACGGDDPTSRELPPAHAVDVTGCSPITYGGKGRPDLLIGVSTILAGQFREHGIQISQALRMVLGDRDWRAGDFNVGLQVCGETTPRVTLPTRSSVAERPGLCPQPQRRRRSGATLSTWA